MDLKCDNLPITLITHLACKDKLNTCTNKEEGRCQTQTCENSKSNDICSTTTLKWKDDMCFAKPCSLANMTNHLEFNAYLDSCTFNLDSNAIIGCASIPLRCDAIFNIEACKKKKAIDSEGKISYKNCGWDGNECVDFDCEVKNKNFTLQHQVKNIQILLNVKLMEYYLEIVYLQIQLDQILFLFLVVLLQQLLVQIEKHWIIVNNDQIKQVLDVFGTCHHHHKNLQKKHAQLQIFQEQQKNGCQAKGQSFTSLVTGYCTDNEKLMDIVL